MGYIGKIVLLALLSAVGISQGSVNVRKLDSAKCQPWRIPVEVDPPKHDLKPYYVEMHRCLGECTGSNLPTSPLLCECAPKDTQNVTIKVLARTGYTSHVIKNHTSCVSRCKVSNKERCIKEGYNWDPRTCTCGCPKPASGTCPQGKVWNMHSCQCECSSAASSCSSGMFWNESSCSCQCSITAFIKCSKDNWATDLKTCRCNKRRRTTPKTGQIGNTESSKSETKLVVSLVVIGLFLGTLFITDLVLMCSKKGFMYGLVTKCSEKKEDSQIPINETEAETGSIMHLNGNYPVVNGSCKHKNHYVPQAPVTAI